MYESSNSSCTRCKSRSECSFRALSDEQIEQMESEKRTLTFARGETIFHLGDDSAHFFCVKSGNVQLYRSSPYREQSFSIAAQGDWIGFRDALNETNYQHNARCLNEATVCKFNRTRIAEWMDEYPEFARAIACDLATQWTAAENQTYNLGSRKIMERLADFLLQLKRTSPVNENQEVEFNYTRELLATLLGTTTESVIRTLSDFKSRGWINMSRGKIQFLDDSELARLVAES
ncbi:MAG: Crp/Fnr family transcriptional regulator [Leptospiraceae bacterium]|nr:Crp/Fnr family transcriptional regulator [Leptospiraceae bacterium]